MRLYELRAVEIVTGVAGYSGLGGRMPRNAQRRSDREYWTVIMRFHQQFR